MFLKEIERNPNRESSAGKRIERLSRRGVEVPQILHIFAYKPVMAEALGEFSETVMRGPSPLSPGLRELIAAFTSDRNHCVF